MKVFSISLCVFAVGVVFFDVGARFLFSDILQHQQTFIQKMQDEQISWQLEQLDPAQGRFIAHPFWGYRVNPRLENVNRVGFYSDVEFPYRKKSDDELVIGVYGGSVAGDVYRQLRLLTVKSQNNEKCRKKITVLNFSLGAAKQPTQFNIFHHFIDSVDFAVNVDGHNDSVADPDWAFPAFYPNFSESLFNNSTVKQEILGLQYEIRVNQAKIAGYLRDHNWLTRSFTATAFASLVLNWYEQRYHRLAQKLAESLDDKPDRKQLFTGTDQERHAELIDIWAKYVRMQHRLARSYGKTAYFFVQPTQYLDSSKTFTDHEEEIAITKDRKHRRYVRRSFTLLLQAAQSLQKEGLPLYDLTRMFGETREQVFIDDCCHLNDHGNRMVAKEVMTVLGKDERLRGCLSGS